MDWRRAKKLKPNPDKMEMLLLGGSSDLLEENLPVLDEVTLSLKDQVCNLVAFLDPALSMVAQISAVMKNAFYKFWLIVQLHPYLDN